MLVRLRAPFSSLRAPCGRRHAPRITQRACTASSLLPALATSPRPLEEFVGKRVLLVGEGDFSFCRAAARVLPQTHFTATSLESEEDIAASWGGGEVLQELRRQPNVSLLHGVDGTRLEFDERLAAVQPFDRVLFMFPHHGRKGQIQLNRLLLASFFRSCGSVLRTSGAVEVALGQGHGGTPLDAPRVPGAPLLFGNSWQAALQAAEGGFVLGAAEYFDAAAWMAAGYTSRGCYRGLGHRKTFEQSFRAEGSVVHVFAKEAAGVRCAFPLSFEFDLTVWADKQVWALSRTAEGTPAGAGGVGGAVEGQPGAGAPAEELAARALTAARGILDGEGVAVLSAQVVDVFSPPEDAEGRLSACLRVGYRVEERALTHDGIVAMHCRVREGLPTALPGLSLRTRAARETAAAA